MHNAIVTGGTRGIGYAIAMAIRSIGGNVMITGTDQGRVDRAVATLAATTGDGQVAGSATDVRDRAAVDRLVADTVARFGSLDILVNNAGIGVFKDVASTTDEEWSRTLDVNLTGVFYCTRAALPALKQAGGAWVINIASLAGRNYFPNGAAYCASKAGLIAFTESLMQEVRHDDIRVSVIMPGSVATEFGGPMHGDDQSWKLTGDDVAEVVVDLLRHPGRSLPSKIEIRPSKPKKG
jgi:NAD(P)-dependent dehydrogenase (short-subunit alcohol dehydrogenase family)